VTETTEAEETPNALNHVKDLVTKLRAAEALVVALKFQIALVKDELTAAMTGSKPKRKPRAPRPALGPGVVPRKTRGPNKPKPTFTAPEATA
jgi:hypothetical protein